MSNEQPPSTRELISSAEALRGDKKGRVPKTRQLVRDAEGLIGRGAQGSPGSRIWLILVVVAVVGGGLAAYLLFGG
ncbi:MAG: hypothetical protein HY903_02635 [Deltaproteobacteria bacterium]|nr:hypothetical protein [Deltaproteobacteria bacterium]